jgi:putative alpha-1,2-mannosidase
MVSYTIPFIQAPAHRPSGFTSQMGGLLTFKPNPSGTTSILARVGVSFISVNQACSNAESDIPDWDFDGIRKTSWSAWNELLGRIKIDTTNVDDKTAILFYSSVRISRLLNGNKNELCLVVQNSCCTCRL